MDAPRKEPENHAEIRDPLKVFLKRTDQVAIAIILGVCATIFVTYLGIDIRNRNGLVHIEQAEFRNLDYQIDINAADWPELANLPGIGEKLARRIVEHRVANGSFLTLDSLLEVNGIGEKKLEQIRRYLPHLPDGTLLVGP